MTIVLFREQRVTESRPHADGSIDESDTVLRNCWGHQSLEEVRTAFPQSFRKECSPADTLTWVSGLQNYARMNFCCFKPPPLWWFLASAIGTTVVLATPVYPSPESSSMRPCWLVTEVLIPYSHDVQGNTVWPPLWCCIQVHCPSAKGAARKAHPPLSWCQARVSWSCQLRDLHLLNLLDPLSRLPSMSPQNLLPCQTALKDRHPQTPLWKPSNPSWGQRC